MKTLRRSLPDLFLLAAGGLVAAGSFWAWPPLGLVVSGAGLFALGLALEHRRAVAKARAKYRKVNGRDPDPS